MQTKQPFKTQRAARLRGILSQFRLPELNAGKTKKADNPVLQRVRRLEARKAPLGKLMQSVAISAGLFIATSMQADVSVDTIGGSGVEGFRNGVTSQALFNDPHGMALDASGNLFIADRDNNKVRKVTAAGDVATSMTTTFILGLTGKPVDVAISADGNLLVLTANDGRIRKYGTAGSTGNLLSAAYPVLTSPTAFALDSTGNIYVTQLNGQVRKISTAGVLTLVASGFNQPQGITVLPSGMLAVSDTGNHTIRLINPDTLANTLLTGTGVPGFEDGASGVARFNQPHKLAKGPNGTLVVADRLNHRVRIVTPAGAASTLYGVDSGSWHPSFYPGWQDGNLETAHARDIVAVAVATNGNVFATELRWDILRYVTGGTFGASTNGGGGGGGGGGDDTNEVVVISPPSITPSSGYFPSGQTISVNSDTGFTYFTTDGSEPTTNSSLVMNGVIVWRDSLRDLSFLRLRSFQGTNSSLTTSGQPSSVNEIGIPRNAVAGPGATVVIPVVINLRDEDQLRSVQFRVEVSPLSGAPAISEQFRSLQISSNDFVQVVRPSESVENLSVSPYSIGDTRGLAVAAFGTSANFFVKPYAVAVLVAVPIPAHAQEGQSYRIEVLNASGTSDGGQAALSLSTMSPRTITVQSKSYVVGDSSPGVWYNAGDFGEGKLFNADVNNAFYASFGIRVPYDFTDAFDAMDVGRPGRPDIFGGDGSITAYDWQKIYQRSIGLDPNNWARTSARNADGVHVSIYQTNGNFTTSAGRPVIAEAEVAAPGTVWLRHAVVGAGSVVNAAPGSFYSVPVYVKVTPGYSLASLQFRATMLAQSGASEAGAINFVSPIGANFQQQPGSSPNDILCSWSAAMSSAFTPQLQGSNLLGYVNFQVPFNAQPGQSYRLKFSYTDGFPDFDTEYKLENLCGHVWVQSPALTPAEIITEEWKTEFFGSGSDVLADDDSDGDGFSNAAEYLAGTDPTEASSRLQFSQSTLQNDGGTKSIALQWLTAPGKIYVVECASSFAAPVWTALKTQVGDGNTFEFIHTNVVNDAQFYRIRLQP